MARDAAGRRVSYLHGHYSVVYCNLLGEEVCANGCFVTCAELLVDLRETVYELGAIEGKPLIGRDAGIHIDSSDLFYPRHCRPK
jgi:hypothetical protein